MPQFQPQDATVSVSKAARLLGVHPNTIRAWSDQGRLTFYRINARGDRRYRTAELERFLTGQDGARIDEGAAAAAGAAAGRPLAAEGLRLARPHGDARAATDPHLDVRQAMVEVNDAIRRASDYAQMANWTGQLQSIQQLGHRLNRLRTVREIGVAIATELRQVIDNHNIRVYRTTGDTLVPIAMMGRVGEYVDETPEQLRIKVGQGITGWVATQGIAQNLPNAAADPRAMTIPGTEPDLDESMLLAPMVYDDQVLGVLVLSKLGLDQFGDDDLRLLVIYASFAAVAMANAESTELLAKRSAELERQLRSQRELLSITESILTTLDPSRVLEQITDRLAVLVSHDNVAIELVDRQTNLLSPLTARGIHAEEYLMPWQPGESGIATWVVEHDEPVLVEDELADSRVLQLPLSGPLQGSLIVVPLRGREGVVGVLTLERLGADNRFDRDDFELVKLFAAQVSIALQNAEIHSAVEIRARSDGLTRLLNNVTFKDWLAQSVAAGKMFSLIIFDLDDFRMVNNTLGHPAGDRFLQAIAEALVKSVRRRDSDGDSDHVFRYGGDEFAMILPGSDAAGARQVAERARLAVAAVSGSGSAWAASRMIVTTSVGVATFPPDGTTAEALLLAADRACFAAKRSGRNRVVTADEALATAGDLTLQAPTPVDQPSI